VINFKPAGLTGIGQVIGAALGQLQADGSSSLFGTIVTSLLNEPTVGALDQAYHLLSGSLISVAPQVQFDATAQVLGVVVDQMDGWRVGSPRGWIPQAATGHQDMDQNTHLWLTGFGSTADGVYSNQRSGGAAGIDRELNVVPALVGLAISGSNSWFSTPSPGLTGRASDGGLSLYAIDRMGPAYASVIAYAGMGNTSRINRTLSFPALTLSGSTGFKDSSVAGQIEGGYTFDLPRLGVRLTPFLSVQPAHLWQGGAVEYINGYGSGLRYKATQITATPTDLGFQVDGSWASQGGGTISPTLRLAWMHDFMPGRDVPRGFDALPQFTVSKTNAVAPTDAVVIRAAARYGIAAGISLLGSVNTAFSGIERSVSATGSLQFVW